MAGVSDYHRRLFLVLRKRPTPCHCASNYIRLEQVDTDDPSPRYTGLSCGIPTRVRVAYGAMDLIHCTTSESLTLQRSALIPVVSTALLVP
jgi:hypothetical protein